MDVLTRRISVIGLVTLGLVNSIGCMILVAQDKTVPSPMAALAGGCVGALASLALFKNGYGHSGQGPGD